MNDRETVNETATEQLGEAARRLGRETASRTTEYVRDGLGQAAEYARDWSAKASDQIAELTGRPPEAWTRELRSFVEGHPLKALLITVAIGYVLGKMTHRS